ncbi:unnamed protein product [Paramecium octaurelia]|uniref:Uncharacterized protein n=1 Tax=Paramecium octaurelia TaxID=43137 RepID=A0A8S1YFC4_PAROT|nr:unnamed protein product [Paramecium octaurelia]
MNQIIACRNYSSKERLNTLQNNFFIFRPIDRNTGDYDKYERVQQKGLLEFNVNLSIGKHFLI